MFVTRKVLALGDREARLLSEALKTCQHITAVHLVLNCELTDASAVQSIYDRTFCHQESLKLRQIASNAADVTEIDW